MKDSKTETPENTEQLSESAIERLVMPEVTDLRKAAKCIFLATEEEVAHDLSDKLNRAANTIEDLAGFVGRISYEIGDQFVGEFESMMEQAGKINKKALIDNALTLLGWSLRKVSEGNAVGCLNEKTGTFTELNMPVLENARPPSQKEKEAKRKKDDDGAEFYQEHSKNQYIG